MSELKTTIARAVDALGRGEVGRAEGHLRRLLARAPGHPDALHLLGCVRVAQGRARDGVRLIERAILQAPAVALYHENLGEARYHGGDLDGAEGACRLALRLDETLHRAHNLLGVIATERGDHEEAVQHLLRALEARSPYLDALLNLAVALNHTGDHDLARDYSQLALRIEPGHPLALTNLGMACKGMRDHVAAREAFEAAGDFPKARFNLGYTRMLEGDLAGGLPLLEARKELLGLGRGLGRPEWDGAPLAGGTLLVIHEQGMGDTLLMARFFARLCDRCERVVVQVQPPLARLVATLDPRLRVVTALEGERFDRWVATMSLPYVLGVREPADIPLEPWFEAVPSLAAPDRPRVGLNWAGNPRFAFDAVRSTHLATFALLLQVGDVEWVSLHKGHLEHEAEAFGLPQPLREATDFLDTARVVASCDLVISTETAVPNLAAALGVPTCVLTAPDSDWRWEGWYPGVTVCRQATPGDWSAPLVMALEAVRDLLERRAAA